MRIASFESGTDGSFSKLLDQFLGLENREQNAQNDECNKAAHHENDDRLQKTSEAAQTLLRLEIEAVGDASEHLGQVARFFTDRHHMGEDRREDSGVAHRLGDGAT